MFVPADATDDAPMGLCSPVASRGGDWVPETDVGIFCGKIDSDMYPNM